MFEPLSPGERRRFAADLLDWYEAHRRRLPWRETSDPYRIWVAEVMLQQTRTEKVKAYYERFLEAFPTVKDLARAPLDRVLKMWEGLGYYARARNLRRAAELIVKRHGAQIPDNRAELLELPGIGSYTAGAILSIAYNREEPVLDGNVRRVLSRVLLVEEDPRRAEGKLQRAMKALIPSGRARGFNQAMMELGATVCLPRSPRCDACPVGAFCRARRHGRQDELPLKPQTATRPHQEAAVGLIWKDDKLLISRRPEQGLLGGL